MQICTAWSCPKGEDGAKTQDRRKGQIGGQRPTVQVLVQGEAAEKREFLGGFCHRKVVNKS